MSLGLRPVLCNAAFEVRVAEVVAVQGRSGTGKSTLLDVMAGLIEPANGVVTYRDADIYSLSETARRRTRLQHFGFVFQSADLLPELTIRENIELPLRLLSHARHRRISAQADAMLDEVGIPELGERRPSEVSGGQLQRAAVARALIHQPDIVFADEPTGSLDEVNADHVLSMFLERARQHLTAVVIVTHDAQVAAACDRTQTMNAINNHGATESAQ